MRRSLPFVIAMTGSLVFWLSGCGDNAPKLCQVEGKILVNGKSLETGSVNLHPEDPKGMGWTTQITGGAYSVSAAKGKYKVTITPPAGEEAAFKALGVDGKYLDSSKTPLSLDVVATPAPGAYDLKLTK